MKTGSSPGSNGWIPVGSRKLILTVTIVLLKETVASLPRSLRIVARCWWWWWNTQFNMSVTYSKDCTTNINNPNFHKAQMELSPGLKSHTWMMLRFVPRYQHHEQDAEGNSADWVWIFYGLLLVLVPESCAHSCTESEHSSTVYTLNSHSCRMDARDPLYDLYVALTLLLLLLVAVKLMAVHWFKVEISCRSTWPIESAILGYWRRGERQSLRPWSAPQA